ncbi:MAG: rod shape-determining protein MreC [Candidatus Moraniibacteriota bacterium]
MRRGSRLQSSKFLWVILSLTSLFLLSFLLPRNFFLPFRFVFQTVITPFETVFSGVGFSLRDFGGTISSIGDLKQENARLNEERVKWHADEAMLLDIQKENEELRKELALPLRTRFTTQVATVIARDPAVRGKWIFINVGSFRGIEAGMAVVAAPGVMVGVIDEVYLQSSRVKLLSHPESALPGRIAGQNTRGIVRGEYALGMMLGMISQADTVKNGDSVVTDDLERNIPSGLLIGTLQSLQSSVDHLFLESTVMSPIQSDSLRFVSVLKAEESSKE